MKTAWFLYLGAPHIIMHHAIPWITGDSFEIEIFETNWNLNHNVTIYLQRFEEMHMKNSYAMAVLFTL